MLDVFHSVFTEIKTAVVAECPDANVTGQRIAEPTKFPCVTVVEADNYEDPRYMDNSLTERVTALMYEITVFSNIQGGKRDQCIGILQIIDTLLKRKNATRIARIEGFFDAQGKIYMVTARYRVKSDGTRWYTF